MFLTKTWNRLNPLTRLREKGSVDGIRSAEAFRVILERERVRVDRYGGGFSLLAFDLGNRQREDDCVHRLAQVLASRLRACDEVGWLDEQRIAVVLPDTPAVGARKLADDVCHAIDGSTPPPASTVYTYPSGRLPEVEGNSPDGPSAKSDSDRHTASAIRFREIKAQDNGRPMERIEPLLVPRLPAWKRALDIVGAVLGFILILPFFLLIAMFIKIVSPGPVFFKQERVGYLGKLFTCWKFRTMRVNADLSPHEQHVGKLIKGDNPLDKLDDDDLRIIPLGRLMRKAALDELPQLLNVLRGEMSLVGPRPDVPYAVQRYTQWHNRRCDAIPGMTGLWQVSGKNRTTFKEMMRLDIKYVRQKSFWFDVKILLKTFPAIISQMTDRSSKRKDLEYAKKI